MGVTVGASSLCWPGQVMWTIVCMHPLVCACMHALVCACMQPLVYACMHALVCVCMHALMASWQADKLHSTSISVESPQIDG